MKKISFKQWNGGISNDEILGLPGSQKMMEGVDILNNSQYVKLAKGGYPGLLNTRPAGDIVGSLYENNINYLEISRDGYINNFYNKGKYYLIELNSANNIGTFKTGGAKIGWLIGNQGFYTWNYNATSKSLGILDDAGYGINGDAQFNNDGNWTIGAGWAVDGQGDHTAGNTDALSRTIGTVTGKKYRFEISGYASVGNVEIKIGGTSLGFFNAGDDKIIFEFVASGDNDTLEFDPSSDFDGYIDNNYIREEEIVYHNHTFLADMSPYTIYGNYIYVGNGTKITRIDLTIPTVPVFVDFEIINGDYTVKGLTRIGDQFFIYASNGVNSKQYLWDGIDKEAQRVITWVDKPIQNVANFANVDYVITGTEHRQTLSVVNGYNLQPLINTKEYINSWDRIYFNVNYTNSIETIVNKLLIPGENGIYSYGKVMPAGYSYSGQMAAFSDVLNKEYIGTGGIVTNMFFSTSLGYNLYVYVKGTYNGVYGNYKIEYYLPEGDNNEHYLTQQLGNTGWIETKPYLGTEYSNIKNINKYVLGYKLEDNTHINTYIKDKNYVNVYTTSDDTFIVGDVYSCNGVNYTIKNVDGHILNCETDTEIIRPVVSTFTKVSGTGPTSFNNVNIRLGYRFLNKIDDTTKTKYTGYVMENTNKIEFAIELVSTFERNTPKLYNFDIYFDEINQDD